MLVTEQTTLIYVIINTCALLFNQTLNYNLNVA